MYCLGRLAIFPPLLHSSSSNVLRSSVVNKVTMKIIQAKIEDKVPYIERNEQNKRALAPHLTAYRLQLTSILSISHRMCGVVLSGYFTVLGVGGLVSPYDFTAYAEMIEGLKLSNYVLLAIKYVIAFPFSYHFCNGIRHLLWDYGMFLKIEDVYKTGYIMLAAAVALNVALILL